ncbi:hypothetical protein ACRRTK_022180 [Alexandromys fortis]
MLSILLLCACLLQACLLQALLQRVPALPPCVQTCLLCAQLLLLCLLLPAQLLQALLQHVPALPPGLLQPGLLWPEVQLLMGLFWCQLTQNLVDPEKVVGSYPSVHGQQNSHTWSSNMVVTQKHWDVASQ